MRQPKKVEIIVEKGANNVSGRIQLGDDLLTSTADTLEELVGNFKEQLQGFYEFDTDKIEFRIKYEIGGFFATHKYLNISEVGKRAKINAAQMRHYASGIKYPSEDKLKQIEIAVHQLGEELRQIQLVPAE